MATYNIFWVFLMLLAFSCQEGVKLRSLKSRKPPIFLIEFPSDTINILFNNPVEISPNIFNSSNSVINNCLINPPLPDGLVLNPTNCSINGTPYEQSDQTEYSVTAYSSSNATTTTIHLSVVSVISPDSILHEVISPSVQSTTTNSISFSWLDPGNIDYYRIAYKPGNTPPEDCTDPNLNFKLASDEISLQVTGLNHSTIFGFRICTENSSGAISNGVTLLAQTDSPNRPPEPLNVVAFGKTSTSMEIHWSSGGGSTDKFIIRSQEGDMAPFDCSGGIETASDKISINGLNLNSKYSFRICSLDSLNTPSLGITQSITLRQPMISKWNIPSAPNNQITLPLRENFQYNAIVDWGDGSPVSIITSFNDPDKIHHFESPGNYTITIFGTMESWYFNNEGQDRFKITDVLNLGDLNWKNLDDSFRGCSSLVTFSGGNTENVTNMYRMFLGATSLITVDLTSFNTSKVENMSRMFHTNFSLINLDLRSFDTSNVTNMASMFQGATNLANLQLDNMLFNTSNVRNMSGMFAATTKLESLDLNHFDTAKVTNIAGMFKNATGIKNLDLRSFNVSNVLNMNEFFQGTTNLTSLDVTGWSLKSPPPTSIDIFTNSNPTLSVICTFEGGTFFGKMCTPP